MRTKFFLSNAPESVSVETLLLVAFSRWRIERMFEDRKDELGMDHFEVRRYVSIQRHLILTCVSHLFLAEFREQHRGKNPDPTIAQLCTATQVLVGLWYHGGRRSRNRAESIAAQLTLTQQRNEAARRAHRKRTVRRLQAIGVFLKNLRMCEWTRK